MSDFYSEHDPCAAAWLRELIGAGLIPDGVVDERDIRDVPADDLRGHRSVHLFAGIGGWPLALRLAGWPDDRPVWTGSCPCQPFSSAGKRKGQADDRHLWPAMFRLVRECRPDVVFGEQVEGAVRLGWLDGICADLEGEGYAVGAAVLGAHSAGAPHIRQRLYWVADASGRDIRGWRHDVGAASEGVPGAAREQRVRANSGDGSYAGELGDPDGSGSLPGRASVAADGHGCAAVADGSAGRAAGVAQGDAGSDRPQGVVATRPASGAVVGTGAWDAYDLIPCRDGKLRRVPPRGAEPGIQPLVDGFPSIVAGVRNKWLNVHPLTAAKVEGRVGLLKGAGNAICPQTAAAFVRAYLEVTNGGLAP